MVSLEHRFWWAPTAVLAGKEIPFKDLKPKPL
jgi:hypothetical protein